MAEVRQHDLGLTEERARRPPAKALPSIGLIFALFLAALNLRPAIASVSPLLVHIRADEHLSRSVAGLLTTIPTLCIGVGALLVPSLSACLGRQRALTYAVVLIGVATAGRLAAGAVAALFSTTLLAGAGIAMAQTLLLARVRDRFAEPRMLVTSRYSLGITFGAAMPAAATAPIWNATGSWQAALAVWAVFALAAAVALAPLARKSPPSGQRPMVSPPWRERRAWEIALFFGGASGLYFVLLAWLAPVYEEHGWSATRAGPLVATLSVAQAAGTLILVWRSQRFHDRRPLLLGALALLGVGMGMVAVTPFGAPVLGLCCSASATGSSFP